MDKEKEEEVNTIANMQHPQHPLPEEIRQMDRDDTVCQFCGVSYLILNEIKNLQKELNDCKKEVERLKHYDDREKLLHEKLDSLDKYSKEILNKLENEKTRSNNFEDTILQKNLHISQLKNNFESCTDNLNRVNLKNEKLKNRIKEHKDLASKMNILAKGLHEELLNSRQFYLDDISQLMEYWNIQKSALLEGLDQMYKLHSVSDEEYKQAKLEYKQAKFDMDGQLSAYKLKIQNLESNIDYQNTFTANQCSKSIDSCRQIKEFYDDKLHKFQDGLAKICGRYRRQILHLNRKVEKLAKHLKKLNDNKSRTDLSVGNYEQEIRLLQDERSQMVNAHQHQIKQLHDSFRQRLLEAEGKSTKHDETLNELKIKFNDEKKEINEKHKESLSKLTVKCKHLNDSIDQYKRDAKRFDEKLKMQHKKFAEEKTQLLKEMTDTYEKATAETEARYNQMNEEKAYHMQTIKKLEQQCESMREKFHGEMMKHVEEHEKEKRLMENQLSELSIKLKKTTSENSVPLDLKETFTRKIDELQSALGKAKEAIKEKSNSIEEYKEEISTLRDCVRRECEERFELTESLAEARTELLSQRRFQTKSNSPKQLPAHPLITNNGKKPSSNDRLNDLSKSRERLKLDSLSAKSTGNLDAGKVNLDASKSRDKQKLDMSAKSTGNLADSKINLFNLTASTTTSLKSSRSQNSASSGYSKNKLRISLKNR